MPAASSAQERSMSLSPVPLPAHRTAAPATTIIQAGPATSPDSLLHLIQQSQQSHRTANTAATIIQAGPATSPDSLLHLIQQSQQSHRTANTAATALPTPSLDALADMDLTALRQLALQRGDSVSAAFQAFAQARASNQHRREEFNRMLEQLEGVHGQDEDEDELDDELDQDEDAYFDDLFSRSGELNFFPPDEDDEHGIIGFGDNLTDEEVEMGAHWPGLLAERPLNPSSYDPLPLLAIPPGLVDPSFFPSIHATSSLPPTSTDPRSTDPPSSTSFSSFLQPGVIFQGTQSFERRQPPPPPNRVGPDSLSDFVLRSTSSSRLSPSTALLRPWGPEGGSSLTSHQDPYSLPLPSLSTSFPHLSNPTSANALDMNLATSSRSSNRQRERNGGADYDAGAYEIGAGVGAGGRWNTPGAHADTVDGGQGGGEEREKRQDEQWGVKVVIHTYSAQTHTLTGLMHAVGVPSSPLPITTYFSGSIIAISSGERLLSSTSMTTGIKQARLDAEYWSRLGPFKGVGVEELKARQGDQRWLEERTRGWILMRWKEREFVNVAPTECTLTIAGHYLIALNRSSGQVEGLYCDPTTPPYQRLQLSPAVPGGKFALGAFEFR